jgi:hypothetical protein
MRPRPASALTATRIVRVSIDCLCIWLALVGCGVAASTARAQDNFVCGNLYLRVTPDTDRVYSSRGDWFLFQVFRRGGGKESPVLSGTQFTQFVPNARCVGGLVLMVAFSPASGDPTAFLVFQNGSRLLELLDGYYEVRGDVFVIPPRPPLPRDARERIPAEYRNLFEYRDRER